MTMFRLKYPFFFHMQNIEIVVDFYFHPKGAFTLMYTKISKFTENYPIQARIFTLLILS